MNQERRGRAICARDYGHVDMAAYDDYLSGKLT
jgi:hypothetical protein